MFSKLLRKKNEKDAAQSKKLREAISKVNNMNLTEMRTYANNKISSFAVTTEGLLAIMNKLTLLDKSTTKLYLSEDDMDVKKKKAFDLVLLIAKNKKLNLVVLAVIQKFNQVYTSLIAKFDQDNKEIYASRFKDMIDQTVIGFISLASHQNKMKVLGN